MMPMMCETMDRKEMSLRDEVNTLKEVDKAL